MDDILDSLTKQGRKLKQRLRGRKNKPEKTGADNAEGRVDSSSSFLQSVPHISTGGHDGAGSRASTDERQAHSRDRSPQPESVSVGEREEEADDEKEVNKEHSPPDPDFGVVGDGEPVGEAERVHAPPSSPSTPPPTGEPESMRTHSFRMLYLTILSGNAKTAIPDHATGNIHPNENTEPSVANEKKSDWKSTASATAKLILRGVRDSADAFPPLKSVAGGLCFILENCEVGPPPHTLQRFLHASQRTKGNEETIGSLAPRVKTLSELLCGPVSGLDPKERERRKKLER